MRRGRRSPAAACSETVVVDNALGNVPYFYVPELKKRRHHAAEPGINTSAMRMWQWFETE